MKPSTARPIVVTYEGETLSLTPVRVDRAKLYGTRKRLAMDGTGRLCTRAALTSDGEQLLASGMLAQGYFTPDGGWVPHKQLVGIAPDGNVVEPTPSTLGVAQAADGPIDPGELLAFELQSVYWLQPPAGPSGLLERLKRGEVFRIPFNYATSLMAEVAYLVANDEGVFALAGQPVPLQWVDEGERFVPLEAEDESDDLDFEDL